MTKMANDKEPIISRRTIMEGCVGMGMLVLAFSAIAASDVAGSRVHGYWAALLVIYAAAALVVDRLHSGMSFTDGRRALSIALHWIGVFAAMMFIYFFATSGRFANTNTGLAHGLILALGTFLYGVHGNWRLMVVGGALGIGTLGIAVTEENLWVLFGIAVLALLLFVVGSRVAKSVKLPTDI